MSSNPVNPELNHEAIPAQQPIAASPGPQHEQRPRSGFRSGWLLLLVVLVLLVLLGALQRGGTF